MILHKMKRVLVGLIPVVLLCGCSKADSAAVVAASPPGKTIAVPTTDAEGPGKPASVRTAGDKASQTARKTAAPSVPAKAADRNDQPKVDSPIEEPVEKPRDLGPPLVDDEKALKKLDPAQPVWIDARQKQVIMVGETCRASYPLEFFTTTPGREYEAVTVVRVKPSIVHAGLLAVGAKAGSPAKFRPEYSPPTGTEIAIEVRWKDKQGKVQHAPAQQWVRSIKTKKPLDINWVFAGSRMQKDEETGRQYYLGDSGDFISVLNLPTSVLDLPIRSASDIDSRTFEGFVDNMPPERTPVTIVLKPKLGEKR
jgi:hypothetical protein